MKSRGANGPLRPSLVRGCSVYAGPQCCPDPRSTAPSGEFGPPSRMRLVPVWELAAAAAPNHAALAAGRSTTAVRQSPLDGAAVSALREDSRARARWVTAVRQVTGSTGGRRSSHNGGCVQPDRLESCAPCCPGGRTPAAAAPRHSGGSTAPQRGQPPGCCPRNGVPRGHAPVAAGGRDRYPARGRWSRR